MIKNVSTYLEGARLPYWEVRRRETDSNTTVFRTDDSLTFEQNLDAYRRWEANSAGRYFLIAKQSKDSAKGNASEEFSLSIDAVAPVQQAQYTPAIGAMPEGYISEREMNQRIDNLRLENKLERMEERQKELEERADKAESATNKFMAAITPYIGPVINGLFPGAAQQTAPAQVAVAGMDDERMDINHPMDKKEAEEPEYFDMHGLTDDEAQTLIEIGARLKKAEPEEWIGMLGKIAGMAEAKDAAYMMARGVLVQK